MLALRLPIEVEERLDRLANMTGRSKSYYAREAIVEHLSNLEDIYMAEKVMEDIRAGREKTVPLDQVMAEFGLDC